MGRATKRQIKALGLDTDTPAEILKTVGMALRYPITQNARAASIKRITEIAESGDPELVLKAEALLLKADQMNQADAAIMQRERHHAEEIAALSTPPNQTVRVVYEDQSRPALPGKQGDE